MKRKAVFIDRDGTINQDPEGYIDHPDKFKLYDFTIEAIKCLNKAGFLVFIVTNQSGIARGYFTTDSINKIHLKLIDCLSKQNAKIDEIFISPYHKDGVVDRYKIDHFDRKPNLGMFYKALKKYRFSIKDSYMIGDKETDILFGKNAKLKTILVMTGEGKNEFLKNRHLWIKKPDFIVECLFDATLLITNKLQTKP